MARYGSTEAAGSANTGATEAEEKCCQGLTGAGGSGRVLFEVRKNMDKIRKIRNRQQARFLAHLQKTGQLTPCLETDVKRAYTYFEQDVETAIQGKDKETEYDTRVNR